MELPSPLTLKQELPLSRIAHEQMALFRASIEQILHRTDPRLVVIVGPCSIHDPASAMEYAYRLQKLSVEIEHALFPIMRLFIEKPRTYLGWKGVLYDPHLDGSNQIEAGLKIARKLFLEITELGVPCATELLEPLVVPYFDDLVSWGFIGARTSASQPHRQMASALPFPVGFKNDIRGELDVAIAGVLTARLSQSHIHINGEGKIASLQTEGNPLAHLVLRGSNTETNYDSLSVARTLDLLQANRLPLRLLIDCSHGNSGKDYRKQQHAVESIIEQVMEGNEAILGFMLESHLFEGRQPLTDQPEQLQYGVSITDPCLGWEETESLLKWAAEQSRHNLHHDVSISMSSVQK